MPVEPRKRKSHKKSRAGCVNCKIRRIKCDETTPECAKCTSYGVSCSYDHSRPGDAFTTPQTDLQHTGESTFQVQLPTPPSSEHNSSPEPSDPIPLTPPSDLIPQMLNHPLTLHTSPPTTYHLTPTDLETLHRYQTRTVLTIGTARTVHIYRDRTFALAFSPYSYLTHIILTLTLMHDRLSTTNPLLSPSTKESFHWYHGLALFNSSLCRPVLEEEKDALWGTAALLGCCTLANFGAESAEEAWPLKENGPEDLDWLRMSDGKKEVWRLTDPTRETSVWREALGLDLKGADNLYERGRTVRNVGGEALDEKGLRELDALYPFLTNVYDVDGGEVKGEVAEGDPYHTAASILVRLVALECSHATIMYFLSFLGHMDPKFRALLHKKDPKALLLMGWWFAKMLPYGVWWLERRGKLECQAIVLYLEKTCQDPEVLRLLDFPRAACGLA